MIEFGGTGWIDLVDLGPLSKVVAVRPWTLPFRVRVLTLLLLGWPRFWRSWDSENVMVWYAVFDKCPRLFGGSPISSVLSEGFWCDIVTRGVSQPKIYGGKLTTVPSTRKGLWLLVFWWVSNRGTVKPNRRHGNPGFCECRVRTCPEKRNV